EARGRPAAVAAAGLGEGRAPPGNAGTGLLAADAGGAGRQPWLPEREGRAARALRDVVPALRRGGSAPEGDGAEAAEVALRARRRERRRRGPCQHPRLSHLLRPPVPGAR